MDFLLLFILFFVRFTHTKHIYWTSTLQLSTTHVFIKYANLTQWEKIKIHSFALWWFLYPILNEHWSFVYYFILLLHMESFKFSKQKKQKWINKYENFPCTKSHTDHKFIINFWRKIKLQVWGSYSNAVAWCTTNTLLLWCVCIMTLHEIFIPSVCNFSQKEIEKLDVKIKLMKISIYSYSVFVVAFRQAQKIKSPNEILFENSKCLWKLFSNIWLSFVHLSQSPNIRNWNSSMQYIHNVTCFLTRTCHKCSEMHRKINFQIWFTVKNYHFHYVF